MAFAFVENNIVKLFMNACKLIQPLINKLYNTNNKKNDDSMA